MVGAYCPASLSLIFKSFMSADVFKSGSTGIGFTLNKGVIVRIEKALTTKIFFNGNEISFPTVKSAMESLTFESMHIYIESLLPLGFGFGISSASSLATVYAVNHLLQLKILSEDLNKIAHRAEIENRTGLGSVGTQVEGGFLVKTRPGMPVKGYHLPIINKKIYVIIIDKIETPTILNNPHITDLINLHADAVLNFIGTNRNTDVNKIIDLSYEFAHKSALIEYELDDIIKLIRKRGGHATVSMIGKVIITTTNPVWIIGYPVRELNIINDTVKLLHTK